MKKKMMKALRDLNAYIDDDRQKLCDELHEVKLSHKRLERLLRKTCAQLEMFADLCTEIDRPVFVPYTDLLVAEIKAELSYPYFRVNYKQKGNKNG